jgi:uncharacterized protein YgfB (UPF0149 family)
MSQTLAELELFALEAAAGPEQGLTPAELHGATIGIGVGDPERFELSDLVGLIGPDVLTDGETLGRFVGAALDGLHAQDMSFRPLLPDDDVSMADRLSALAHWCQSFLEGLVVGLNRRGIAELGALPDEVQEIVQDMVAIAQLDTELAEENAETDFMELEEYVKVGTLLILSLNADADADNEE